MTIRKLIPPAVTIGVVAALGVAGYATRERWLPVVFPPNAAKTDSAPTDEHAHAHADRVKLSAQAQANLRLDVDALTPGPYWRTVVIPGVVVDRPGESDRGVTARLAGVVTDVKARPGDTVKAGDPLFVMQLASEYAQSAQADLAKAAQELRIATTKRDSTAGLVKAGTASATALAEDEAQVKRFTTQVQTIRRQLQTLGFTAAQIDKAEKGEAVTEVVVTAPARAQPDGSAGSQVEPIFEVQDLKVQLGEQVQAGQTLGTLAYHQRLFVEGRAFKSEAKLLAEAARTGVPIAAEFADEAAGDWPAQPPLTIHHLSNQVDPATRTFAFYLPLDNQPTTFERDGRTHFVWRYRPGQRVRLKVPAEKLGDGVFVLPAAAVVREGPEAFVFVQNGDLFVRKPVRVLHESRTEVVVANDGSVGPGQFVVRNQAAALNRALKAAAESGHEGHSHEH